MLSLAVLIQLHDQAPLYVQVFDAFREAILSGDLSAGTKLPSSRKQAQTLGVSRNIVLLAYDQLLAEGYAETQQGSGTYVSAALPDEGVPLSKKPSEPSSVKVPLSSFAKRALQLNPGSPHSYTDGPLYDLRYGLSPIDEKLLALWRRHLAKAAQNPPLNYADTQGSLGLRTVLSAYLKRSRGVQCSAKNIIITSGSQQALYLSATALLEPNDPIVIEEPCYQGANQIFLAHKAKLIRSNVDEDGMYVPRSAAKLAYITPSHQFPTGAVMSLQRRLELLSWAKRHNAFILEDDYDSEYRYEGKPIAAVQGLDTEGRVIYMGTFSKTLFPALRLGFLVLPESLIEAFTALKWLSDRHKSSLEQAALTSFIADGHFERHLRRTRTQNAKNRLALLDALELHFGSQISIVGRNAGIHVMVWFNAISADMSERICLEALELDVGVYPIAPYYTSKPKQLGLLVGYASLSEAAIREAVKRLASVIQRVS